MGILYIVGTPIGNLGDITLRAIEVLREADLVICEDTRVTAKLLKHCKINKSLKAFHSHSRYVPFSGSEKVAYVSDAGTPGLSDPGAELVREALALEMEVVSVPGPSAISALISLSDQTITSFTFHGFPPHKKGRETLFQNIANSLSSSTAKSASPEGHAEIFYESPNRIVKALTQLEKYAPDRRVLVGRELTKKFEEVLRGTVTEVRSFLESDPGKQRGEFVVLVL